MNRLYSFIFSLFCLINSNSGTTYTCDPTVSCGCSAPSTNVTARIVGGELAPDHAWGWAVSLEVGTYHICGAVLIAPEYALTAAHCVSNGVVISELRIVAGTNYLKDTSATVQTRQILEVYVHPEYDSSEELNDIAILRFSSLSISSDSTIKFICLPASNVDSFSVGSDLVAAGWGVTVAGSNTVSTYLRQVTVQLFSPTSDDCKQAPIKSITSQICAGVNGGGKDTCQGDSGGPLMFFLNNQWVLAGLTSSGIGCAQNGYPGLYTKVSYFISFIEYVMNFGEVPGGTSGANTTPRTPSANSARNQKDLLCKPILFFIFCLSIIINI